MGNIDIQTLNKLSILFDDKGWDTIKNENGLYSRYISLLKKLEKPQQEIIIEISQYFEYYSINDYESLLMESMMKLAKSCGMNNKYFYIPIMANPDEVQTIKSSHLVGYLLKSNRLQYHSEVSKMKNTILWKLNQPTIESINRSTVKYVVLIDDFIGSGKSAKEAATYYMERGLDKDKIIILSLVAMRQAIDLLSDEGMKIFYARETSNIDSYFENNKIEEILDEIEKIAQQLNLEEETIFGYNNSKGLVSMIRTPNNTFSLFWKNSKNKNDQSPFPRFS